MITKIARIGGILLLVATPVIGYWVYQQWTAAPQIITIASGSEGGAYFEVATRLANDLRQQRQIEVRVLKTSGSIENIQRLVEGKVDFALYQPSAMESFQDDKAQSLVTSEVSTVANLYLQVVHLVVHSKSGISLPEQLRGKTVSVGLPRSGDHAMAKLIFREYGISMDEVNKLHLDYGELPAKFREGKLDAAILCVGTNAPILNRLFADPDIRVVGIPHADSMVLKNLSLFPSKIPPGLYRADPDRPASSISTISTGAQLLTRKSMHQGLVSDVTLLATNPDFARSNGFSDLFAEGRDFAKRRPEFPIHPGATAVYSPNFDIGQFEGWEALYSLLASGVIGAVIAMQWIRKMRIQSQEHRLDHYIHQLLGIERKQLDLDEEDSTDGRVELQRLLDEVTFLRQEALKEFTAHELNEDPAAECFIGMCADLSAKINAKISRQRLDFWMKQMADKLSNTSQEAD